MSIRVPSAGAIFGMFAKVETAHITVAYSRARHRPTVTPSDYP